jgi:L-ascorbate peroxidase
MPCLVSIYDCLRAWFNPASISHAPWSKKKLDVHEYYYQKFTQNDSGSTDKQKEALLRAKAMLTELIQAKSCGPILIRAAWHDSGTFDNTNSGKPWPEAGGAIGSIRTDHEINAGPNAGLKKALTVYLKPIKDQVPEVSWADLLQLGSATAIELMGGPKIPMKYGRVDGIPQTLAPAPFGLPDACPEKPAEHLRYVFYKYNMNDKDIVALSGAHTVGRAFKDRSGVVEEGYLGGTAYTKKGAAHLLKSETAGGRPWTKDWLSFDNSYFTDMARQDPDTLQLVTDLVLMEDPGFKPHFEAFKADQSAFFAAYAESHKKLSELGAKFEPAGGVTGV